MTDIRRLSELLKDDVLKSSLRLLILISLAINEKMYFADLAKLTMIGKGSLSNHLDALIREGYIKDKTVFTLQGPRRILSITEKGMKFFDDYSRIISQLKHES